MPESGDVRAVVLRICYLYGPRMAHLTQKFLGPRHHSPGPEEPDDESVSGRDDANELTAPTVP